MEQNETKIKKESNGVLQKTDQECFAEHFQRITFLNTKESPISGEDTLNAEHLIPYSGLYRDGQLLGDELCQLYLET